MLIRDVIKIGTVQRTGTEPRRAITTNDSSQDRVIINVSGVRFETVKSTLEQYPDTLLGSEKRRKHYYDKLHNEYFFNRHRQAFEAIIYYYQSHGRLRRPNSVAIDTFLEEITFFELGKEVLAQLRKEENLEAAKKTSLPRNRCRRYLWATLEYPEFSFIAKCVHILSLLVIAASTLGLTFESLPQYTRLAKDACGRHRSAGTNLTTKTGSICLAYFSSPFVLVQTVCVSFFTLELILRAISMPSLCGFIKSPMNWIDVFAIVPFYISIGLRLAGYKDDVHTNTYTGFQLLRILRFMRVFKFYRILKNVKAIRVLALTLKESLPDFLILITILTSLALLFGAAAYFAESIDSTTKFDSIPMAIYWGIITITSVGCVSIFSSRFAVEFDRVLSRYGDISPNTPAGRVIACLCALSGAGTIAMLVSVLVDRYQRVFNRKLYVEPVQIDFDDYSDGDDDTTESQDDIEEQHDEEVIKNPLSSSSSNQVRCIISYTDTDGTSEESQKLIDRLRSIVSQTQFDLNDITLNVITDTPLGELPLTHAHFGFTLDDGNNISSITEIDEPLSSSDDDVISNTI